MEAKAKLLGSLLKVQATLNVSKSRLNSFGGYAFRNCEDILEAVKPLLKQHELHMFISDEVRIVGDRFYVVATVTITDGESTHTVNGWAREPDIKKGSDPSQITGAASSYARKCALNGMFLIDDSQDVDTVEYRTEASKKAKQAVKAEIKNFDAVLKTFTSDAAESESVEELQAAFKIVWKELSGSSHQQKAKEVYDTRKAEIES